MFGNGMGMGIAESHGNGNKTKTREWKWEGMETAWEWEGMGIINQFLAISSTDGHYVPSDPRLPSPLQSRTAVSPGTNYTA